MKYPCPGPVCVGGTPDLVLSGEGALVLVLSREGEGVPMSWFSLGEGGCPGSVLGEGKVLGPDTGLPPPPLR